MAFPVRIDIPSPPPMHGGDGSHRPSRCRDRPCNRNQSLDEPNRASPIGIDCGFESRSLRRSPRLIMPVMLSSRNREVSLGSPSSPVRCRTLHAMLKDCSKSSVSLILYKLSVNQRVPTQHRGFRAAASSPVDHPSHPSPAPRFQSGAPFAATRHA